MNEAVAVIRSLAVDGNHKSSGVYCILNTVSGKVYIGSAAVSIERRWAIHRNSLRRGKHENLHLQHAWTKRSESSFEFLLLAECSASDCVVVEQRFLDLFFGLSKSLVYNIAPKAFSCLGIKRRPETREKLSKLMREKFKNPAFREKMKRAGVQPGQKLSLETRRKMSQSRMGKRHSDEVIEKINAKNRGRVFTEQAKQNMKAGVRRRFADPVALERHRELHRSLHIGKPLSDDVRAKISKALRGRPLSPEHRMKISAAHKGRKKAESIP
jgi:group I intron endonuclease